VSHRIANKRKDDIEAQPKPTVITQRDLPRSRIVNLAALGFCCRALVDVVGDQRRLLRSDLITGTYYAQEEAQIR